MRISVRLFQIDEAQYTHVISLFSEIPAGRKQDFGFGVRDDIVGVGGQDIGQHKAARFGRAAATDNQHVERTAVLVGIQAETNVLGQGDTVFLRKLRVDGGRRCPRGRTVFLAIARPALICLIKQNCHAVGGKADENCRQAFVCPHDICWSF